MPNLYITVFEGASEVATGDPIQELVVAIGGTSAQSGVFTLATARPRHRLRARLFAESKCFATWGTNPVAAGGTDGRPLAAESAEYFDIEVGYKVAVIERI